MTVVERPRISWRSWTAITWLYHSKSITVATVITVLAIPLISLATNGSVLLFSDPVMERIWAYAPTVLSALVAMFWAAPMVAREYEEHTSLFAWSQDATPARWVFGRSVPLLVVAVVLTTVLNIAVRVLLLDTNVFTATRFESDPFLHATYVIFGFALGLACGVWLRSTPSAIGATLVAFLTVRILIATSVRPHLLVPSHGLTTYDGSGQETPPEYPPDAYVVDSGYLDLAGDHSSVLSLYTHECLTVAEPGPQALCFNDLGIHAHYTDFQPVQAMWAIRIIEGLIYLALAACLGQYTRVKLRRRRHV
jgi:hypothetical protein